MTHSLLVNTASVDYLYKLKFRQVPYDDDQADRQSCSSEDSQITQVYDFDDSQYGDSDASAKQEYYRLAKNSINITQYLGPLVSCWQEQE
jgi:hypothetical protein